MLSDYSDQEKIFDPKTWSWPVHLIGAGGINNLTGILLAKMGISEIHIWDDDILENRNLPTEIGYSSKMRGQPKVAAMAATIDFLMPDAEKLKIHQHQNRVTKTTKLTGVVIVGVDSMKSRQEIWQNIAESFWEVPFFIDGRSGGEEVQIFAFSPGNFSAHEEYETWLFDDEEAAPLECGARNIGYISAYVAAEIASLITKFHRGIEINDFPIIRNFANS